MTSGIDYIIDNLFHSNPGGHPKLELAVDEDVLAMLRELEDDQAYNLEELAAILLKKAVTEHYQTTNKNVRNWEKLSQRQQQVAALACLEYTNAEIAEKLHISVETVKTHMREVLRKFDVKGRYQLGWILRRWDFSDFDIKEKD